MSQRRITDYLTEDHERIRAWLLAASRREQGFDPEAYSLFRRALLRHIGIEEKLLFAALRREGHEEALTLAHALRVDHAALGALLVPTPDAALCEEIGALLAAHDQKEEGPDGVYAACERALSPRASEAMAAEAARFPEVPVAPYADGPRAPRTVSAALAFAARLRRRAP